MKDLRALLGNLDLRTVATYLGAWAAISTLVLAVIIILKGPS